MIGDDAITKEKMQLSRRSDMVVDEELEASKEFVHRTQAARFKIQDSKEICENQDVEVQNETTRIVRGIASRYLLVLEEETQGLQLYIKTWAYLKQSIARMLEEIRRSDDQDFYLP
ncbi:hypothetical protein V6N13_020174 [Hibiscus sabdariffa]|uniref:Uncharacterized protein n=1 Tax=Hibiscus sabdariffa TaxID=183260 RepID=A0ABR2EVD8_9ROSI